MRGQADKITGRKSVFILGNGKDSSVAVCSGKWKLIVRYGKDKEQGNELYNLSQDLGELKNVANQYPEIAKQLAAEFRDAETRGQTRR